MIRILVLLGWGSLLAAAAGLAEESKGTPAARALVAEGEAATRSGNHAAAMAAFRKAIDADPDFAEAHQRFIEMTRRVETPASRTPAIPHLQEMYERWAAQHPKRAVYRWALGFLAHDSVKGDSFFKEALAIDPTFARAHFFLARNADLRGDWAAQRRHLQAAVENAPDEPRYLLRYADAFRTSDPKRFQQLASSVVDKFPQSPQAVEALHYLARESSNPERRAYLAKIRANYPPGKFPAAVPSMTMLYSELTSPSEALALAKEMATQLPTNKTWAQRVVQQEGLARTGSLIAERKFLEALQAIENTPQPSGAHRTTWVLLKAEAAAGAGRAEQAYSTVLDSAAATPDARVEAALGKYGAAVKRSPDQINADVWRVREAQAKPAAPFQLLNARSGKPVRLSDYRGRIVLVSFWFPG